MLAVERVSKMYSPKIGLKCADFTVAGGETLALIGPNGSGKSTLLKVISNIHQPSGGVCTLGGLPIDQCKDKIGFLPETPYLIDALSGIEFLKYIAGMKCVSSFDVIDELLRLFQANAYATKKLRNLSQGQRKRIALIAALIGDPYLLILDEPTNGFDTITLLQLKSVLIERHKQHKITIFSSHVLDFVENVASKVIFIKNGETLQAQENIHKLEAEYIRLYVAGN